MLKQKLDQKQVQKLILAPALQQAIRLLPLTNLELIEIIDAELSQNPLLEEVTREESSESAVEVVAEGPGGEAEASADSDEVQAEAQLFKEDGTGTEELDWETIFQDYLEDAPATQFFETKEALPLENILARGPSLWDHLSWQASLTLFSDEDQEIAQHIIGNINEDGYLTIPVEEIASSLGVPVEKVEAIRQKIKGFDPVGSASFNLREMLLAQMDYLGIQDEMSRRIVESHLSLLEKADYNQLARELGISLQEVKDHLEVIRQLDPAPGRKYSQEKTSYVMPDIIVTKEDNDYLIILNNEGVPRLRINSYYRRMLARASGENPEAYTYLKDQMKRALWFLKSLNQREQTVYRVAKAIIDRQRDFLEKGIDYLKPLTLTEIAAEVGVHESTVGRVVANKFIQTPRGVFSLKYFFHKSLPGSSGEEISSLRIKERIKKLIEGENPSRPLSDTEISDILARENVKIARRTVAKYRKQLRIPPSHMRKRKSLMEGKR